MICAWQYRDFAIGFGAARRYQAAKSTLLGAAAMAVIRRSSMLPGSVVFPPRLRALRKVLAWLVMLRR
jgi:hypothetical protein